MIEAVTALLGLLSVIAWRLYSIYRQQGEPESTLFRLQKGDPARSSLEECTQSLFDERAEFKLSIVVPAYNEEKRLPAMLKSTVAYISSCHQLFGPTEVIVVDDGSTDQTAETVIAFMRELNGDRRDERDSGAVISLKLCRIARNSGKGYAVKQGILRARGDFVLFADADNATDMQDLGQLFRRIRGGEGRADCVCGSRAHLVKTVAVVQRSVVRNALMHLFHMFLNVLGANMLADTQCGFKLFTREASRRIFPLLHLRRWAFDIELLSLAGMLGLSVEEVPVNWREIDGSKVNLATDSIQMAWDVLRVKVLYAVGFWKLSQKHSLLANK